MNPKVLDAIFLGYMAFSLGWGYFSGGVSELFSLVGLFAILAISMKTYNFVAVILINHFAMSNIASYITAFFIVFFTVYVLLRIVKKIVERKISASETMTAANRSTGMAVGAVKGLVICLVVAMTFLLLPLPKESRERLDGSFFIGMAKVFEPALMSLFGDRELLEAAKKMSADQKGTTEKMMQSPEFQKIITHPKVQDLAMDPDIKRAVEKNDFMALMSNKKFLELMNDQEIMNMIRSVDLPKLLSESTKKTAGKAGAQNPPFTPEQLEAMSRQYGAGRPEGQAPPPPPTSEYQRADKRQRQGGE